MPGYLVDTQTITYWFDGKSGQYPIVQSKAEARRGGNSPLYVSAITLGEIKYGHAAHPAGAGKRREDFLTSMRRELPQILSVSRHTAEPYGRIRAALFDRFGPRSKKAQAKRAEELCDPTTGRELGIDENDLWLVAQAVERNLVLVTHDKLVHIRQALQDLQAQQNLDLTLRIEDWAEEGGQVP